MKCTVCLGISFQVSRVTFPHMPGNGSTNAPCSCASRHVQVEKGWRRGEGVRLLESGGGGGAAIREGEGIRLLALSCTESGGVGGAAALCTCSREGGVGLPPCSLVYAGNLLKICFKEHRIQKHAASTLQAHFKHVAAQVASPLHPSNP